MKNISDEDLISLCKGEGMEVKKENNNWWMISLGRWWCVCRAQLVSAVSFKNQEANDHFAGGGKPIKQEANDGE